MTQSARLIEATQQTEQTVSVIICCYTMERLNDIREAMNSVLNQTLEPCEIILSVDHNKELYQTLKLNIEPRTLNLEPQIRTVLNTGVEGLSETRNVGIRAASGDIVAFIDDDAVAEPDWLENLVKPFRLTQSTQGTVVAVGGQAIPLWLSGSRPSWFPEELDWIVGCTYKGLPVETLNLEPGTLNLELRTENLEPGTLNLELRTIRNVPGCNMAFEKEIFDKVGGFRSEMGALRETPRGGEEANLCLRIKHQMPDALILYRPNALIHHKVPPRRLKLKYVARRSYNEGFYKSIVEKLSPKPTPSIQQTQALSTESSYLRYLLFTSIPGRLRRFYKRGVLLQAGAIMTTIVATGAGYFIGKVIKPRTQNFERGTW